MHYYKTNTCNVINIYGIGTRLLCGEYVDSWITLSGPVRLLKGYMKIHRTCLHLNLAKHGIVRGFEKNG